MTRLPEHAYPTFKSVFMTELRRFLAGATTTTTIGKDDANAVYRAMRQSPAHVKTLNLSRDKKDKCFSALVVGDRTTVVNAVSNEDGVLDVTTDDVLDVPGTTLRVSRIAARCVSHHPILDAVTRYTYVIHQA